MRTPKLLVCRNATRIIGRSAARREGAGASSAIVRLRDSRIPFCGIIPITTLGNPESVFAFYALTFGQQLETDVH